MTDDQSWAYAELQKDQLDETPHPTYATPYLDQTQLVDHIVDDIILHSSIDTFVETSPTVIKAELRILVNPKVALLSQTQNESSAINDWTSNLITVIARHWFSGNRQLYRDLLERSTPVQTTARNALHTGIYKNVVLFISSDSRPRLPPTAFSTQWLDYLRQRGILLDPWDELDWSGRGQHVEYGREEASQIPLSHEETLGHSASAVIDSVRCRRIRLARKLITCNRRLRKEDAIIEVEHLFRLPHAHIVRVVGTYTYNKSLAILLYPATEWDLDSFMESLLDVDDPRNILGSKMVPFKDRPDVSALPMFVGCLSDAICFIHDSNIKHMDIKPKNLLVRRTGPESYKIYIADFGIARAYKTAAEADTESPTAFTRAYAAPEVVLQDTRGFAADIFSLGGVFMEMVATWRSYPSQFIDERAALQEVLRAKNGNGYFYASIDEVLRWFGRLRERTANNPKQLPAGLLNAMEIMIEHNPLLRPTAYNLRIMTTPLRCRQCNDGPEPFEAASTLHPEVELTRTHV